jgi:hypothetical protein
MGLVGQRVDWELGKAVARDWDEVAGGFSFGFGLRWVGLACGVLGLQWLAGSVRVVGVYEAG